MDIAVGSVHAEKAGEEVTDRSQDAPGVVHLVRARRAGATRIVVAAGLGGPYTTRPMGTRSVSTVSVT